MSIEKFVCVINGLCGNNEISIIYNALWKIKKFLLWWENEGIKVIPDYADPKEESKRKVPSWRRICKVLLKNDYWCKGLSFSQTKKELEKQIEMITRYNEEL